MSEASEFIKGEVFNLFCSAAVGEGIARKVYESPLLPGVVIKVESPSQSFQNIVEWETWKQVEETPWAKWFAPCVEISSTGAVLIMKKTNRPKRFPDRVPAFFTDLKRANYGAIKGQLVAHDYGTNLLMQTGLTNRMKKADWWD